MRKYAKFRASAFLEMEKQNTNRSYWFDKFGEIKLEKCL